MRITLRWPSAYPWKNLRGQASTATRSCPKAVSVSAKVFDQFATILGPDRQFGVQDAHPDRSEFLANYATNLDRLARPAKEVSAREHDPWPANPHAAMIRVGSKVGFNCTAPRPRHADVGSLAAGSSRRGAAGSPGRARCSYAPDNATRSRPAIATSSVTRRCKRNRWGYRFQPVDCLGNRSRIRRNFCCRVDNLGVLDVGFLRKVEAMQDSFAAANGPRCGLWLLRNS